MNPDKPDIESFEEKREWLFETGRYHEAAIEQFRAQGDRAAVAKQIAEFDADVASALHMGLRCPVTLVVLVQLTLEPKRRLELLQITYTQIIPEMEDCEWPEQQARTCCEAAWLHREMALLHERAGDHAAARKCYDDALAFSLRAGDLAYTHFMSECQDFNDGDAIPIRPRLMEDLARIGNNAPNP